MLYENINHGVGLVKSLLSLGTKVVVIKAVELKKNEDIYEKKKKNTHVVSEHVFKNDVSLFLKALTQFDALYCDEIEWVKVFK